jgi:hypothetical protein
MLAQLGTPALRVPGAPPWRPAAPHLRTGLSSQVRRLEPRQASTRANVLAAKALGGRRGNAALLVLVTRSTGGMTKEERGAAVGASKPAAEAVR